MDVTTIIEDFVNLSRCHRRRYFLGHALCAAAVAAMGGAGLRDKLAWAKSEAAPKMRAGQPSATARGAALSRAVHQVIDYPRVFEDPFALPILAPLREGELQTALDQRNNPLRASIVMRSRYAEDSLAHVAVRGMSNRRMIL